MQIYRVIFATVFTVCCGSANAAGKLTLYYYASSAQDACQTESGYSKSSIIYHIAQDLGKKVTRYRGGKNVKMAVATDGTRIMIFNNKLNCEESLQQDAHY